MRGTFRYTKCELALRNAAGHVVGPRIVRGDLNADRINVGSCQIRLWPEGMCCECKQARPGTNVSNQIESLASTLHVVKHREAAAGGFMTARAKSAACLNQERRRVFGYCPFVGTGVDIKATCMDRL